MTDCDPRRLRYCCGTSRWVGSDCIWSHIETVTRFSKFILVNNIWTNNVLFVRYVRYGCRCSQVSTSKGQQVPWKHGKTSDSVCCSKYIYTLSIFRISVLKVEPNMFSSDRNFKDCQNTCVFTLGTSNNAPALILGLFSHGTEL